jgi:hypothetical protein
MISMIWLLGHWIHSPSTLRDRRREAREKRAGRSTEGVERDAERRVELWGGEAISQQDGSSRWLAPALATATSQ